MKEGKIISLTCLGSLVDRSLTRFTAAVKASAGTLPSRQQNQSASWHKSTGNWALLAPALRSYWNRIAPRSPAGGLVVAGQTDPPAVPPGPRPGSPASAERAHAELHQGK